VLIKIGTVLLVTGITIPVIAILRTLVIAIIDAIRDKEYGLVITAITLLLIFTGITLMLLGGA